MTASRTAVRWTDPLILAVALGCGVGLLHVLVLLVQRHYLHLFTWHSRDAVWMSPLGNVLWLLVPAAVLSLAALIRPGAISWRLTGLVLGVVAALGTLLLWRGVHWLALVLLAGGVAWQFGQRLARHGAWWRTGIRRAAIGGTALAVFGGAIGHLSERASVPTLASPGAAPNVLLIILDTVRASALGLYGAERATSPAIDSLAAESIVFDQAIAPAPWTLPSHASMFTGHGAGELAAGWRRPFDGAFPSVAAIFRDQGYATGAFVGNTYYTHYESGVTRGFDVVRDFDVSLSQIVWSTTVGQTPFIDQLMWARSWSAVGAAFRTFDLTVNAEPDNDRRLAGEVIPQFLDWQRSLGTRPFFAFINLFDAHAPYSTPPRWDRTFGSRARDRYDGGIAYMDAMLDSALRVLKVRGVLERTIVVITSDHGEQFGEHGLHDHGNSLYLPLLHVPLLIHDPNRVSSPPRRVARVVSLRNLAASLLDLAGRPSDGSIPGVSLMRDTSGEAVSETGRVDDQRQDSPAAHGDMASLVSDSLHLIVNADGKVELFNHVRDPQELSNLATDARRCPVVALLLRRLRERSPIARRTPTAACPVDSIGKRW